MDSGIQAISPPLYWMVECHEKISGDQFRREIIFMRSAPDGYYLGCATPLVGEPAAKNQIPIAYAYNEVGRRYEGDAIPNIVRVFSQEVPPEPDESETLTPLYANRGLLPYFILLDIRQLTAQGRTDEADVIEYLANGLLQEGIGSDEVRVAVGNIAKEIRVANESGREIRPSFIFEEATHALNAASW